MLGVYRFLCSLCAFVFFIHTLSFSRFEHHMILYPRPNEMKLMVCILISNSIEWKLTNFSSYAIGNSDSRILLCSCCRFSFSLCHLWRNISRDFSLFLLQNRCICAFFFVFLCIFFTFFTFCSLKFPFFPFCLKISHFFLFSPAKCSFLSNNYYFDLSNNLKRPWSRFKSVKALDFSSTN